MSHKLNKNPGSTRSPTYSVIIDGNHQNFQNKILHSEVFTFRFEVNTTIKCYDSMKRALTNLLKITRRATSFKLSKSTVKKFSQNSNITPPYFLGLKF